MIDRHLDFEFEVGESERHNVAFQFDQLWGPLKISVDGKPVITQARDVLPAAHQALRVLGGLERAAPGPHREDPQGPRGGFQAQECVAYVDGREVGRYSNAA